MSIFTKIKNLFNKKKDFNKAVKEKVEENVLVEQKKFDDGLKKSSSLINDSIDEILKNFNIIDEKLEEKILETFISFDIGYHSSKKITNAIIDEIKIQNIKDSALIKEIIVDKLIIYYIQGTNVDTCLNIKKDETNVILVSGVNGVGKTTTIAKLAYFFKNKGFSICLIAADTFRAAAVEQLEN
jgi:fused signal recognition particle receptor